MFDMFARRILERSGVASLGHPAKNGAAYVQNCMSKSSGVDRTMVPKTLRLHSVAVCKYVVLLYANLRRNAQPAQALHVT